MSSLYELTTDFLKVQDMIYDDNYSAEAIQTTLECIDYEIEQKADNYAKLIKNINVDIEGLKKEIERLQSKKQALENKQKFLKDNLKMSMITLGKNKIKTNLFSFSIHKSGKGKVTIYDIDKVPKEFLKQPEVKNKEISEYLKDNDVEWAYLGEPQETLFIR